MLSTITAANHHLKLVRSISRRSVGVNGINAVAALRCKSTVGTATKDVDPTTTTTTTQSKGFFPVYVHNVSKMVLEHLQENQSAWIMDKGLDRRLNINPNGTFSMSFPARKGFDSGRIWTSYDSANKQHWLSVYRQKLAVRFLLKEYNSNSPKVHDASTTVRQIGQAVDQMISAVNQMELEKRRR